MNPPPPPTTPDATLRLDREWFRSERVIIGDFRCDPGHARFGVECRAFGWPSVAFPRAAVGFRFREGGRFVADPATAVLFHTGQVYQRERVDPRGSCTEWIEVRPDLLADMLERRSVGVPEPGAPRFGRARAPAPSCAYMAQRELYHGLVAGGARDPIAVEECAIEIVDSVIGALAGARAPRAGSRRERTRRRVAAEVSRALWDRLASPPTLDELADAVELSPYYVCTAFKAETGRTIRAHLHRMRLRRALELLDDPRLRLCEIALALGYVSESHFSDTFARVFGHRPSVYRRRARGA